MNQIRWTFISFDWNIPLFLVCLPLLLGTLIVQIFYIFRFKSQSMKRSFLIFAILGLLLISCTEKENQNSVEMENTAGQHFYVGTYTNGDSEGIYKYKLNTDGTLEQVGLVARTANPSFLAHNGEYLVAVNENEEGTIQSFRIGKDSLHLVNTSGTGGAHPCFVTMNKQGNVLVANYTGGNVGWLDLSSEGMLSKLKSVQQHKGSGPTDRQESAHAHSTWFVGNSNAVISVDLGTDELWLSKINSEAGKLEVHEEKVKMAAGAGPRHLAFHTDKWIYVLNELNGTITRIIPAEGGGYEVLESVSTLPADFDGFNKCADIHLSSNGKFLYASNRGHDSIVIYEVAEDGALKLLGFEPTKGATPRNFTLSPNEDFLLVANKDANNIVSFKRDAASGGLEYVSTVDAPAPVCLLF
jgi:6-phosphogluconolactonase